MSDEVPVSGLWSIDPAHSSAEFVARHMMIARVKGRFKGITGEIEVGPDLPAHKVTASVEAATVNTGDEKRDEHLRSPDFFDIDNYKLITFASTKVEPGGSPGKWRLHGDLTIKGMTRPVVFDFEYLGTGTDPWGAQVAAFEGTTEVNRKDFGLKWNMALESGGFLVGDNVTLNLAVQAKFQHSR